MADAAQTPVAMSDGYNVATGAQFLRWWKTHLWACVPARIRAKAKKNARPMAISLADDAIWPERSDLATPLRLSKTTFLSGDANKTRPVALVAGETTGLRRKVELPLAVEERLAQVLAYELDRLTPLRADDLYFDYRLLSRSIARGVCVVELVAAPKKRINEMIASAKAMGAEIVRVVLASGDIDEGVDLLRKAATTEPARSARKWLTPALAGLCVLLALALVAYPLLKKRQHIIDMMPIETSARAEAEAASIVQRQLERQITEYNHLLKRKHASPIAVQVLEDMTKRLPEDTWAQSFEIKAQANSPVGQRLREVIVQGETGSGAKLLQMVQESTLLKDPVLKAAMTRVSPTAERFHFAGELVSVASPQGLALADASAVLGTPMQVMPNSAAGAPIAPVVPGVAPPGKADAGAAATPAASPTASAAAPAPTKSTSQPSVAAPANPGGSADLGKKSIATPSGSIASPTKASADGAAQSQPSEEKKP